MPIRFRCSCGKTIKVEDQFAGRHAKCPYCGAQLVVPNASTLPDASGPKPKAGAAPQPPAAPASELQLEIERIGPGGKTADTAPEVTDIEEPAPEAASAKPAAAPAAAAPPACPPAGWRAAPSSARVCPNCGKPALPQSVICVECGANLAPEKASAGKTSPVRKLLLSLREHKSFPLIAAVAGVVVILIVTVIIIVLHKPKPPAPAQVAQLPTHNTPPPPPPPVVPDKPKPTPEPQFRWSGFTGPALVARDHILKIGQDLAAYMDKNHQPPAALADAGVTEAESAGCEYVGAEIAALPRFRAMAFENHPATAWEPFVLFSDGSARPVPAAQIPSVLLHKTAAGWTTGADDALLAQTAPVIRVANLRFASLQVDLDDKPAGVAPRGGACDIPAAVGKHQLTFTGGGQKDSLILDLKPGIICTFVHPRQADLAWLPIRQYRAALLGQPSTFKVDKQDASYAVKSLKGPETVDFPGGDGRSALATDLSWIAARITRENGNLTIEGLAPDARILLSEIGRVEDGILRFKSGIALTYHKTALGALRCEELPNTDPAALTLPKPLPRTPPGTPQPPQPPAPETPPPQLAFPAATFTLPPDCQALADALRSSGPNAVQLLLQRAQMEAPPADAAPARENAPTGVEHSARPQEIPAPFVYAALALYGDSSALQVLTPQCEKSPAGSPAYPQMLLALARSGGMAALTRLRAASAAEPASAVIALCTIDDPQARSALAGVLAAWTPAEVTQTVDAWPLVAGPRCRIAFVEALAAANPPLLENPIVLNALMKLEPFALERALAARLTAETAPPAAPQPEMGRPPALPPPAPAAAGPSPVPLCWIALAHFKNDAAAAIFVQWLDAKNGPEKRLHSAVALGEIRDPGVVPLLITLLKDKETAVRQTAAEALARTPDAAVPGALQAAMDKDLLRSAIVEQAPAMTTQAGAESTAALLAKMLTVAAAEKPPAAPPPANPPAPSVPKAEPGAATPAMIIETIVRLHLGSPAVKTALDAARAAPDPAVRALAYPAREQALALADPAERSASALAAAGQALKDTQAVVRVAGIGLLPAAEPKAALALLLPALKDDDADVRAAAVSALPEIAGEPGIANAITAALSDASPAVVSAAARAAARRHDPAFGAPVLSALSVAAKPFYPPAAARPGERLTDRPGDQGAASASAAQLAALASLAEAAADLHPQEAAGALANLLANSRPEVRIVAVRTLGKIKDATALNSLLIAVKDKDLSVVAAAVAALGDFDTPEAIKASLDALLPSDASAPPPWSLPSQPQLPAELAEMHRQLLTRLAAHCGEPASAYDSWAATAAPLSLADLDVLAAMAPSATPAMRPGLIVIAKRYLSDSRLDAKKRASSILLNYPDDPAVRAIVLNAIEHDPAGIADAAAGVLRRLRDDSMIDAPLLAGYKALSDALPRASATPGLPPPPPSRYAALGKVSPEENALLRAAIIDTLGAIGGDHAEKAIKTIADLERKRNSDDMAPHLIAAIESVKTSRSVLDLCDFYLDKPGPHTLESIAAMARVASLDPARAADTLQHLADVRISTPEVAAAAVDALDQIKNAGGT